jgi:hypothetical protein
MKKLLMLAAILLLGSPALAQTPLSVRQPGIIGEVPPPPRAREIAKPAFEDEAFTSEGTSFFFRKGVNVSLPIPPGAPVRIGLDGTTLTTEKMVGLYQHWMLPIHSQIQTSYGPINIMRDAPIETTIQGQHSGAFKRAVLMVDPETVRLDVSETDYIQVGEKDGIPVYLRPGKWTFRFHLSLQSIESDTMNWKAKTPGESAVVGGRFGGTKSPISDEHISPLLFFNNPAGTIAYAVIRMGGLFGLIFHRPNIVLPPTTELHFLIDRIDATYVAPPPPKSPATKKLQP